MFQWSGERSHVQWPMGTLQLSDGWHLRSDLQRGGLQRDHDYALETPEGWQELETHPQGTFKGVCLNHDWVGFSLTALFSRQSLTLLEYLLKTGDDRVLLKMKDNIYIVKALTEYRFVEKDGKDQVTPLLLILLALSDPLHGVVWFRWIIPRVQMWETRPRLSWSLWRMMKN